MTQFPEPRGAAAAMLVSALVYCATFFMAFDSCYLTWGPSPAGSEPAKPASPGEWDSFSGRNVFILAMYPEYCWEQSLCYWAATLMLWSAWIAALLSRWKWVAIMNSAAIIAGVVWIIEFNEYRDTYLETRILREGMFFWLASMVMSAVTALVVILRVQKRPAS
jgi:hypothetical protein